jgi:hypothetical protein
MENTILLQPEKVLDADSLFLASSIFVGASQTIRDVHIIVAALLRYALIGASITNNLMDLMVNNALEES